jgi:predicted CXXCH cytochrome family protein
MASPGARGRRWLAVSLVSLVALSAGWLAFFHVSLPARGLGREQPIPFSHRLHVTDKGIDCFYCHPHGERSAWPGLPTVAKCLGCHDHIIPLHPWIRVLKGYQERAEPLPWIKVFYSPDHVHFPHHRHLRREVACAECHGAVESQDRLMTHTFYMGFCLDCHKARDATRECAACHH